MDVTVRTFCVLPEDRDESSASIILAESKMKLQSGESYFVCGCKIIMILFGSSPPNCLKLASFSELLDFKFPSDVLAGP